MFYKIIFLMLLVSQLSACSTYRHKKWNAKFMNIDKDSDQKISKKANDVRIY